MKYQIEVIPSDSKTVRIHLEAKLVEFTENGQHVFEFTEGGGKKVLLIRTPRYVRDLLNTDGVENVLIGQHHLVVKIAELFTFRQVWPGILFHLENSLCQGEKLEEAGPPFCFVQDKQTGFMHRRPFERKKKTRKR